MLVSRHRVVSSLLRGYKTLILERKDGVCTIFLNRAKKKNAFNVDMYSELGAALGDISSDPTVKVALLTGKGDYYSSGNDLSNFSVLMHPLEMAKQSKEKCIRFVDSFISFKKPLICAVNGPAIGIAVTTLGLCDKVFASTNATFRTPFAELAQSPEGCSSFMFYRIMGDDAANKILWGGVTLSAQEALTQKLVHQVEDPKELLSKATEYCKMLAALPPDSKDLVRVIIREGLIDKLRQVNEEECAILERKWVSKECFSALAAYLESRKMYSAALVLRTANATGFMWGQPKG